VRIHPSEISNLIDTNKRQVYLAGFILGFLLAALYAADLAKVGFDFRFFLTAGFALESLIFFFVLWLKPQSLRVIELATYLSLSTFLLATVYLNFEATSRSDPAGRFIFGDIVNGFAMWIVILFLGAFLSLSTFEIRALLAYTFLGIFGIVIQTSLDNHMPPAMLSMYLFRWLNAFVGLIVALLWLSRIGHLQRQFAQTDSLTGLLNRRAVYAIMAQEAARVSRAGPLFSVAIFDIDRFKKVNDTFGHVAGDKFLQEFAVIVGESIRQNDYLSRWGGEEFLLVLPGIDLEKARMTAERIRRLVDGHDFAKVGHVTVSFGVATYSAGESQESLLTRADKALYLAKEQSRNLVIAKDNG
jgi:diguanylate cyclase (GGDEF)-like protein